MNEAIKTRWINGPFATKEEWIPIDSFIASQGWMQLNHSLSRVLVKETEGGEIVGFFVFQAIPHAGPMYVKESFRGTGLPDEMADELLDFFAESECRGFLVVPENRFSEAICKKHNMTQIEKPVYVYEGKVIADKRPRKT